MKRAFVIGHPIKHSRSPLIHGTWIADYGVDGSYEAIDVSPADLPGFVQRLRDGEFVGGNVTIPHKEEVFALCDSVDPLAEKIGAVNTLVAQPGKVFSRRALLQAIWGDSSYREPRTIDVHVRHLREKVEVDPSEPELILTVRGAGYRLREA